VAIEDTATKQWWGGTSFSATTQTFVTASGTTSWSLALARVNLTSGVSYNVIAQATDSLGNVGTSPTVSFTYCTALPTVAITYPVNATTYGTNWTGTITGTASSNSGSGTTITGTAVAVENTKTSKWWNGSSFSATAQTFVTANGTTSWSFALAKLNLTSGITYSVTAQATDSLGNVGTSPTVSFTYCTAPPTVAITYPVNKTTYGTNWTGKITGTASSNSGAGTTITGTAVAVENTKTAKWWNGTGFSASSQTFVTASSTTSWSLGLAKVNLTSGVTYTAVAQATDSLGNIGTSSTASFIYCTAPPTVAVIYPVNKTTYGSNWTGKITGSASSNAGAGTTIKSTAVAIENTTTKRWWNGTSFSATAQTFVAASGTTSWSLGLARMNLTSGDTYSVIAEATDSPGNVGTSSTVTFSYSSQCTAHALGGSHD
jgi:ribosomal protein S12 methylthiotransferase accessory factor YcaO